MFSVALWFKNFKRRHYLAFIFLVKTKTISKMNDLLFHLFNML